MDDAHCVELNKRMTNEDLYLLENVKSHTFLCDECGVELIPCSYKKAINLRKPYFKTGKNKEHKPHCFAKAVSTIREQAKKSRITTEEGFPLSYPNCFNLTAAKSVKQSPEVSDEKGTDTSHSKRAAKADLGVRQKNNYVTSSFQTVVDQYFNFPYDRDRKLNFEGITGSEYRDVFQKILNPVGKQKFRFQSKDDENKVFYSTLSWEKPAITENTITVKLSAGWWQEVDGKKQNLRPYYIEIDIASWPQTSINHLVERLKHIQQLVKGTDKKAAIVFVGRQDRETDFYRFTCNEPRLISLKVF
ncbi:hypothetical protein [Shewanella japonica]|uniref:hypothetical protein n=1 Tax=Shewanella japonica TaxID=93973 RepID=UPI00249420DD|nr:hypothetical protein [Shewanella japonica]